MCDNLSYPLSLAALPQFRDDGASGSAGGGGDAVEHPVPLEEVSRHALSNVQTICLFAGDMDERIGLMDDVKLVERFSGWCGDGDWRRGFGEDGGSRGCRSPGE